VINYWRLLNNPHSALILLKKYLENKSLYSKCFGLLLEKYHYLNIANNDILTGIIIINFLGNRWNPHCLVVNIFRLPLRAECGLNLKLIATKSEKALIAYIFLKRRSLINVKEKFSLKWAVVFRLRRSLIKLI
jgi:hypothetical protein